MPDLLALPMAESGHCRGADEVSVVATVSVAEVALAAEVAPAEWGRGAVAASAAGEVSAGVVGVADAEGVDGDATTTSMDRSWN